MTQLEITQKIDALREEYKAASSERRSAILKEVKALYKELPPRPGYCRNCNMKEALPDDDPHFPFCGAACHEEWADGTYGVQKQVGRKSIAEMKKRLLEMAREKHKPSIVQKRMFGS